MPRVAIFNPGSNVERVSVLRLVNSGSREALVDITGTDDTGERPGTTVEVTVPAGDAVELTAAELESGESVAPGRIDAGALGDGSGKWRLRIEANRDITVLSVLSSVAGHLTNLSRADGKRGFERTSAELLPPPATVTLARAGQGELRGRWSAVEGARYAVDLLQDGVRDDDRSLTRSSRTTFRWQSLSAGTYTIRACSINEDGQCERHCHALGAGGIHGAPRVGGRGGARIPGQRLRLRRVWCARCARCVKETGREQCP